MNNEKKKKRRESTKERDHLEALGSDEKAMLKRFLKNYDGRLWNGFMNLRIRTSGGLL
jgi:hypothetical protein